MYDMAQKLKFPLVRHLGLCPTLKTTSRVLALWRLIGQIITDKLHVLILERVKAIRVIMNTLFLGYLCGYWRYGPSSKIIGIGQTGGMRGEGDDRH